MYFDSAFVNRLKSIAQTRDEFKVIMQLPFRGHAFVRILHHQADTEPLADRSGNTSFGVHKVIIEILHLRKPLNTLPDLRAGLEFVFTPFAEPDCEIVMN